MMKIGSINSSQADHDCVDVFTDDSEQNGDSSNHTNTHSTARTTTNNTNDHKQTATKLQTSHSQSQEIKEFDQKSTKDVKIADILSSFQPTQKISSQENKLLTKEAEPKKPAERPVRLDPLPQIKRIDKIISQDDSLAPKSNILSIVEKNIAAKDLTADTLNKELTKIKDLYASFDGAKMTSTLVNLDIEEMCFCLSCAVNKHIGYFVENVYSPEYLEFVKKSYFVYKETQAQLELQNALEAQQNKSPISVIGADNQVTVSADKRQILSGLKQNNLVEQVAKTEETVSNNKNTRSKKDLYDEKKNKNSPSKKEEIIEEVKEVIVEETETVKEETHSKEEKKLDEQHPETQQVEDQAPRLGEEPDKRDLYDFANPGAFENHPFQGNMRPMLRRSGSDPDRRAPMEKVEFMDDMQEYHPPYYSYYEEQQEEIEEEIYPEYYEFYRPYQLAPISERTIEQSEPSKSNHNSQQLEKVENQEEQNPDQQPNDPDLENFLRESLRESVMLTLQNEGRQKKTDKEEVVEPKDEAIESQDNPLDMQEHVPKEDEILQSTLEFSFVSKYTQADDLDSSQIDMDYRKRAIFERTYNDKRWSEQDYLRSKCIKAFYSLTIEILQELTQTLIPTLFLTIARA